MTNSASTRMFAIAGGVAVFLVLVWGLLVFRPQLQTVSKVHKAQAAAAGQVTTLEESVSLLQGKVRQIPAAKQEYAALVAALPDDPQLPAAIDQINSAATASGYSVKSVNPTKPTSQGAGGSTAKAGGAVPLQVSISGTGTYQQTMTFMSDLLAGSRIFKFTAVSFSGSPGGTAAGANASLSSQLSAQMFYAGQPTP